VISAAHVRELIRQSQDVTVEPEPEPEVREPDWFLHLGADCLDCSEEYRICVGTDRSETSMNTCKTAFDLCLRDLEIEGDDCPVPCSSNSGVCFQREDQCPADDYSMIGGLCPNSETGMLCCAEDVEEPPVSQCERCRYSFMDCQAHYLSDRPDTDVWRAAEYCMPGYTECTTGVECEIPCGYLGDGGTMEWMGDCMWTTECTAGTPSPGYCPGASGFQCCVVAG